MEDSTYLELVRERDHAMNIWLTSGSSDDIRNTNLKTMDAALNYLCQCQQRLEERENHEPEREDS